MSDFSEFWRAIYPNAEPTGWLMRDAGIQHWVRFHSLPHSKRYADSDDERSILLGRQNELASTVLGENHSCWMAQACWVEPVGYLEKTDESDRFRETREFGLSHVFSFREDERNDDTISWNVMAAPVCWTRGGFDGTLLRIASDWAAPTLWVSSSTGAVFAPYDGGVDLFLPSGAMMEQLQSKNADWLSSEASGL